MRKMTVFFITWKEQKTPLWLMKTMSVLRSSISELSQLQGLVQASWMASWVGLGFSVSWLFRRFARVLSEIGSAATPLSLSLYPPSLSPLSLSLSPLSLSISLSPSLPLSLLLSLLLFLLLSLFCAALSRFDPFFKKKKKSLPIPMIQIDLFSAALPLCPNSRKGTNPRQQF